MRKHLLIAVTVTAFWTAKWYEMTTCEANKPRLNEFTGQLVYPQVQLAIACYEEKTSKMSKRFNSVGEAHEFLGRCDEQSSNGYGLNAVKCVDQVIEEVHE
jgi:hypothetical protein